MKNNNNITEKYQKYLDYESLRFKNLAEQNINSWADVWQHSVDKHPEKSVVREIGSLKNWTYQELDRAADKIANWAINLTKNTNQDNNYKYIGVHQNNSAIFLATVLGLAKAGITAVLFNVRESEQKLSTLAQDCGVEINIGKPIPNLKNYDPNSILSAEWKGRIPKEHRNQITIEDAVVIIFTSGTSGRSKPALFNHRRMIGAGIAWSLRTQMTSESNCYITLPLYHGNGLAVAFASCVEAGACAVVREKFSVRAFLDDVRNYNCDSVVYIGELWRYLANNPQKPEDKNNPLKVIFGNGLSSGLWENTIERFGIERVVEHFGATEMPASALTNWTERPGYCGFIPPSHPNAKDIVLVDEQGKPVPVGEVGQALLRVPGDKYRGYLDSSLDESKIWQNLFEPGDLWWCSGDLLSRDADGFFTFIDRMGDTFRWKGENVACQEVEEAILSTSLVKEAVVYGVEIPRASGKVGMASLLAVESDFESNLDEFLNQLKELLPPYAIPHIIRLVEQHHQTTSTMKILKSQLQKQGFKQIDNYPHFILVESKYVELTKDYLSKLEHGELNIGFR